jgi:hypothetical protein
LFSLFRRSKFSPLEQQLLEAVASKLDPAAAALFRGQLADVNLIQRHAQSKEVNSYVKRLGSVRRNPRLQFPNQILEAKLATVAFHTANDRKTMRAEFFLVKGFFFSILFSASPNDVAMPIVIHQITVDTDPMLLRSTNADTRRNISISFTGYLADWQRRYQIHKAYEPLPATECDHRLDAIRTRLPSDYLELIHQSDGLDIEDCTIFGLSRIREFAGDDANYYLIAELAGAGMLGVRHEGTDGAVAFITYDHQIKYFPDFRSAMDSHLGCPDQDKSKS